MDTQAIENEREEEMEMAPAEEGGGGGADYDFSSSLKKKKKKKGKEDKTGAAAEKKFPKHVLEMQKILAMREKKQKQEDEERLEAERQEQIQKEEEIREAQQKILRDNEKKKKKQNKQKEKEQAFRQLPTGEPSQTTTTGKRPLYQKKKKKPTSTDVVAAAAKSLGEMVPNKEEVVVVEEEEEQIKREEEIREAEQKIQILSDNEMKKREAFRQLPIGEPSQTATTGKRPLYQKKKKMPTEAAKSMYEIIPNKEEVVAVKEEESLLRSPICCIMGHVDAGKTRLLDYIRGTHVQEGEAGGITQQIGATYFRADNLRERTRELKADAKMDVPGLLVIDTPGHESFSNLRSRGSGLCDIAVLVVDIMHGLRPQTIESLNLLKMRNTNFIVALNKVDRLNGWKTCRTAPIRKAMEKQNVDVKSEFKWRLSQIKTQFMEQGLNAELYYKNKNMEETLCIVPTSAISGEGNPDLLLLLVMWAQKALLKRLTFSNELQCTVLEVKVVEGLGTTIDVVLVNGVLHEGDQIVVCGLHGAIVTTIRALLTPHPMKELRVKGTYLHHKEIKAAQGIKITAQGLEHAIAGTSLYVVKPHDDLESIKKAAVQDLKSVMSRIDKSCEGVYVQASTLGSLEALLEFLKTPAVHIPVSGISIGPVHKKDVIKASVMLEKEKEYGTILAFDVKVTQEARELADERGVKIFTADVIYHLFDQFKAYIDLLKEERKKKAAEEVVYPCVLKIMPNCVFNKKDPIVLGVEVLEGVVKVGTPLWVPQREFVEIGRIASVEINRKPVDFVKKGQQVAIKIIGSDPEEQQKMFGRHFDIEDELVSKISRNSVNPEKYAESFGVEASRLLSKLKGLFKIQ